MQRSATCPSGTLPQPFNPTRSTGSANSRAWPQGWKSIHSPAPQYQRNTIHLQCPIRVWHDRRDQAALVRERWNHRPTGSVLKANLVRADRIHLERYDDRGRYHPARSPPSGHPGCRVAARQVSGGTAETRAAAAGGTGQGAGAALGLEQPLMSAASIRRGSLLTPPRTDCFAAPRSFVGRGRSCHCTSHRLASARMISFASSAVSLVCNS